MTLDLNTSASAAAVVTMVTNQIKHEGRVYAAYVAEHGVTLATVAEHKSALLALAFPGVTPSGRTEHGTPERNAKKFADKVRLGLTSACAAIEKADEEEKTPALVTAAGIKASLAEVTAAWHAAQQ